MAQRVSGKAKRASQRASGQGAAETPASARADALTREVAALRAELDAARAEIASLTRQREQLANRIDWIIDSLHSLLEEQR